MFGLTIFKHLIVTETLCLRLLTKPTYEKVYILSFIFYRIRYKCTN